MNNQDQFGPLTAQELTELENLLHSFDSPEALGNLSEFDGFITAVVSVPMMPRPIDWLTDILAEEQSRLPEKTLERFTTLMVRHAMTTETTLDEYPDQFEPIFLAETVDGNDELLVEAWCYGYMRGVIHNQEIWQTFTEDSDLLQPILIFTHDNFNDLVENFSAEELRFHHDLIGEAAVAIYCYWQESDNLPEEIDFPIDLTSGLEAANEPFVNETSKVGRNDPCPCGSGQKYKMCCLNKTEGAAQAELSLPATAPASQSNPILQQVKDSFSDQMPADLEEANRMAEKIMAQTNASPIDDFHGLSSEQMGEFLNQPFDCPRTIGFTGLLPDDATVPLLTLWHFMAESLTEGGNKATATGCFSRAFCQEAHKTFIDIGHDEPNAFRIASINREMDFPLLEIMRLIATEMKLIRKHKGKFVLAPAGRELRDKGPGEAWLRFFQYFGREFNWGYEDGYEYMSTIQYGFMFSLYLLNKYGNEVRDGNFYADAYLKAFPMLMGEVGEPEWGTPESQVRSAYLVRTFDRFAWRFGLVQVGDEGKINSVDVNYKATPLLKQFIKFNV